MKKTIILAMTLLLAAVGMAQQNPNAKFNLVVGNFSGDHSSAVRNNVINNLIQSYRANVIELAAYNSLPATVRSKMNIHAVITGTCALTTERKESTQTDKNGNKRTVVHYESKMTTNLTFTNPASNTAILTPVFTNTAIDEDRNKSISNAISVGHTNGKKMALFLVQTLTLDEYLQEKYPLRGRILTLDEFKKNKAQVVTINLGGRDAIYRGQTFEIADSKKNYGKLRIREINSDSTATCSVVEKGKEIYNALESGASLEVVSYVQALSLNGIVRAEHEAPQLTATSVDDSKRRTLALGTISGNPPSDFVNSVQQQLNTNLRVKAYQFGAAGCPDPAKLDGIACGYYAGINTSSRLVKAEEHLLQLKDYTEYTTSIYWFLFIVDPNTGNIVYASNESATATSDKTADEATAKAIHAATNISSATYGAYPLIGSILTVDEADQKKAKEVTIDLGSDFPVYKKLRFDVYGQNASSDWEKIGRIEISDVVDGTHASCSVKKGGEKIQKAIEEGLPLRITTQILKELLDL